LRCRKSARRCGAKHIWKSKWRKHLSVGALLEVALSKKCTLLWREEGFVAFAKTMAGVGHLKRICKDGFRVAGALQETCSSEMLGGQAADFLRDVAFWNIRSSGLLR